MLSANIYESSSTKCDLCGRFKVAIGWVGEKGTHACLACIDSALEAAIATPNERIRELELRIARAHTLLSGGKP